MLENRLASTLVSLVGLGWSLGKSVSSASLRYVVSENIGSEEPESSGPVGSVPVDESTTASPVSFPSVSGTSVGMPFRPPVSCSGMPPAKCAVDVFFPNGGALYSPGPPPG
ncbi:hypothetical protein B0T11DRAFT_274441 [Plectosphaerella cucumerina]|uniref:Secreted protein n=1 Tax=Plectosphaerella cucumerina TaxID=40658 RepID=A0A8K0TKR1_9PEZI|nr:hypothetical protein B0T11DRAFT_274441 [Plectosphaerella cucumerina]